MQADTLRIVSVTLVLCCLSNVVLSVQDCRRECPTEFALACGYNAAKNCYRVFENDCELDLVNCHRSRSYTKTSMADCDNPAQWCEHKNILE